MKQLNLKEVVNSMLSELSGVSRASQNTLDAYSNDMNEFVSFCEQKDISTLEKITEKTIRYFVIYLSEKGITKSTISRKLSALRRLFNFALRNELIEKNPINRIPNPKITRKLPETINVDSYQDIFSFVEENNNPIEVKRIKAIFELLYGCALRSSELCSLNIGDIDFHSRIVKVHGKGSKVRIVPLGDKSKQVIEEYLKSVSSQSGNHPLFADNESRRITRRNVYYIVNKYLQRQAIDKKSPHILRHSAATHMLDRDADIMAVKEILGHENLSTTQIYTHVSIERLKKSYKKAHPKS